jgi:uncharacterized protein
MIEREIAEVTKALFAQYPVVTITGPRQSGKTTLARSVFPDLPYLNLEELSNREFAQTDPVGFMSKVRQGAVIDEIQRVPELLSQIQVIVDAAKENSMFVLTGSSQFTLMSSVSQTLAGRTTLLKLMPLTVQETERFGSSVGVDGWLYKGFYPRIYDQQLDPTRALGDYFETYVERDLRSFANIRNISLFERFMRLSAGRIGQLLKLESLANDVGVSSTTIKEWLSILEASYVVFRLQPFHANIRKRLVKTPKLYFYDVGLATFLLGIETEKQVMTHPLRGSLFENMVLVELLKHRANQGKRINLTFYRDAKGNEVDAIIDIAGRIVAVEIKSGQTVSKSYFNGLATLERAFGDGIAEKIVVYAGDRDDNRREGIVTNVHQFRSHLEGLGI